MSRIEPTNHVIPLSVSSGDAISMSVSPGGAIPMSIERVRVLYKSGVKILRDTTENWNSKISYIPGENDIVLYTDHRTIDVDGEATYVPGIKIGDGKAYLIDIPFIDDGVSDQLLKHINDSISHTTQAEKDFWSRKLNYSINGENLILNQN